MFIILVENICWFHMKNVEISDPMFYTNPEMIVYF
jgi:hypothetical protein